jgi:hypothetical protein
VDDTPNLGLPYIMAAQSQKHVTHNEAIRALDALVQLAVLDRDLAAPPVSPAEGARYIVGGSPTGAWSGHTDEVAAYQDGAWMLYAPVEGWIAWIADEDVAVVWDGTTWSALTTGGGSGSGSFTTLAINGATADTTNRLAVEAPATLLNHAGAGHQLKINKAAAGDTASLLYQDAFSGRAELGLAGDDDFHFKVSPDGTSWKEAIVIDRSTGGVRFPFTGGRAVLTANRTYYVRADGSDSNTGLANTSGGALLTIQKAVDVASALDLGGIYTVIIQVGAGTYTAATSIYANMVGQQNASQLYIRGDTTTPSNCLVNVSNNTPFVIWPGARCRIAGFKLQNTGVYSNQITNFGGYVEIGAMDFGSSQAAHLGASVGGVVNLDADYTISGGAAAHMDAGGGSQWVNVAKTITLTGTPAFSTAFAVFTTGAIIQCNAVTFSGSATGARYAASNGGIINTLGSGASYLPGNASGSGTNFSAAPYGLYI